MKNISLKTAMCVAAAGLLSLCAAGTAQATIVYNSDLIDPPGVYFGSGNSNGDWAVDIGGGVELGLRAKLRQLGASPSSASGVYGPFPAGTQVLPAPNPNRATWNYEFSINVQADGNTNRTLANSGYFFVLCADGDCVDPLTNWADNAFVSASGINVDFANAFGVQNSEQLLFSDSPGHAGYDINATGLHTFSLTAFDSKENRLASTAITVRVPEPATVALMGLGLIGLGAAHRKIRHV